MLRRHRLALPAVCVGNLTTGGTGKTPAVAWIAEHYRRRGETVVIVRRGYKRGGGSGPSDETMLLEDRLGIDVIENPDRVAAAREAADRGATLIVLDDGFQHRRARRDLDVVLIDATDPFGGGHMLPWGMLREPLGGLRRAGVFLVTRADQADDATLATIARTLAARAPGTPIVRSVHAPRRLYAAGDGGGPASGASARDWLAGREVRAFSGIGRPDAFERTLTDLGATVADTVAFPDHHDYRPADVTSLLARPGPPWVTTEKDWVKIRRFFDKSWSMQVLGIDLAIVDNEAALVTALDAVLA